MATTKDIEVGGRKIKVCQLTVEQVTDLLEQSDLSRKITTAELIIQSKIPIEAVVTSTGLSLDELNGDLFPDELEEIFAAVEEVNRFLSPMVDRLAQAAASIQPKASGEQPAT